MKNGDKYVIQDKVQILDVMVKHYESVNTLKTVDPTSRLTTLVRAKADEIKQQLTVFHQSNDKPYFLSDTCPADKPRPKDGDNLFLFTNTDELTTILKRIPNKSSTGPDNIPNVLLKNLNKTELRNLTIIYNNSLNSLYFPTHWKTAKLVCIKKKDKDPNRPGSYRPVSLLSNVGKVYEKRITEHIKHHCNENNIIPDEQFGFRDKHSTVHAITKLTTDLCTALNDGEKVGACLIDIEKFFDSVWIEGVLFKLSQKNFPANLILITCSMLTGRDFFANDGKINSSIRGLIQNGLQQGAVSAPIIFAATNSDVLRLFGINQGGKRRAIASPTTS